MGGALQITGKRICAQFHLTQQTTVSTSRWHFWNVCQGSNSKGLTESVTDTRHHFLEAGLEAGSALRGIVAALADSPVDLVVGKEDRTLS